jgi:queuine tRNA-ribosyltransferase
MGLGTPPQILEMIGRGVDMFDCVMPTRVARHGVAFTLDGPLHIKNLIHAKDPRPLCEAPTRTSPASPAPTSATCSGRAKSSLCGCFPSTICISTCASSPGAGGHCRGRFPDYKDSFIRRYTRPDPT